MSCNENFYVVNPVAGTEKIVTDKAVEFLTADRLESLNGKTIYLVDTGFGGSAYFMLSLQKWFNAHYPSVNIIRKRKPGNVFMDDAPSEILWKEISEKGDAAILGVAG